MAACRACGGGRVETLLELGPQPVAHRFLPPGQAPDLWPMTFAVCAACGLPQLTDAPPADALRPRLAWVKYLEPERHLDKWADDIAARLRPGARVLGLSYKEDSLLERLRERGFQDVRRLDISVDLGIADPCAGVESVQHALTPARAASLAARLGRADVVVARHILEHAFDLSGFLEAVAALVAPGGFAAFEIPDCERAFRELDVAVLWEEHSVYFTQATLRSTLERLGYEVAGEDRHAYTMEDSLTAFATPRPARSGRSDEAAARASYAQARSFARELPARKEAVRREVEAARARGKVGLIGVGHRGCTFLNVYGLAEQVDVVMDDDPHKQGLLLPGTRVPIGGSAGLAASGARLCLLAVNTDSEPRILAAQDAYLRSGGRFASISPASERALVRG